MVKCTGCGKTIHPGQENWGIYFRGERWHQTCVREAYPELAPPELQNAYRRLPRIAKLLQEGRA